MGGRYGSEVELYRAISQESPEQMAHNVAGYRAQGYRKYQLKVGGDPDTDILRIKAVAAEMQPGELLIADANTGWLSGEAARVVRAVRDIDVYIEQPCRTYEECLSIRRRTDLPFILDENINDINMLMKAHHDGAIDAINLKISKVGGLTKAKQIRDLACTLGVPMNLEDSWGGDVTTAAIASLAHSTPEQYRLACTDFNSYVSVSTATGAPARYKNDQGVACMKASELPGLGVVLRDEIVGAPVAVYEEKFMREASLADHNLAAAKMTS